MQFLYNKKSSKVIPWNFYHHYIPRDKQTTSKLVNYKHQTGSPTLLDKTMSVFWRWVENKLPKELAPNVISAISWLICITPGTFQIFSPS